MSYFAPNIAVEYNEASMPLATTVPLGTEVFNTTYQVKLRSNGTRWIPLAPFTVYSATLSDSVTGTTSAVLMREVELPFKYIGAKGSVRWFFAGENTNNANGKVMRVHLFDGTTSFKTYDSTTTTTGRTRSKSVLVTDQEYNFYCSNNNGGLSDSSTSNASSQQLAPTTSLTLQVFGSLVNASDTVTLTRLVVQIISGF